MAKYELRLEARRLRSQGISVRKIASQLGVSKGTVSLWVRDIILSVEQLEKLRNDNIKGGELGRLRGALAQKNARLQKIEDTKRMGIRDIGTLSRRDLFIAGLCLYWGEGSKKDGRLQFCNSDPDIIIFMIRWLKDCFGVPAERMAASVGINISHLYRESEVIEYWMAVTGLPLKNFRKTSFKHVQNQKVYANANSHYGTLSINVLKPGDIYYKILGLIFGLAQSQGSSAG